VKASAKLFIAAADGVLLTPTHHKVKDACAGVDAKEKARSPHFEEASCRQRWWQTPVEADGCSGCRRRSHRRFVGVGRLRFRRLRQPRCAERVLYYWDPFGDAMEESHALRAVVAANAGWRVVSIPHRLQSDGYQCGPWSHVALKLFAAYFKAGIFEGFSESFAKHAELRPLDLVTERGRGAVDRAKGINSAFIKGVRDEARKQLRDADSAGSMPFKPDVRPAPPVSPRTRKAMQAQGGSAEASILL